MKYDLTSKLANIMVDEDKDLPARLRKQDELLAKLKCIKPVLGSYLMGFELNVLIETLTASDQYFHATYPDLKSFTREKRLRFAKELREHAGLCARCRQKVFADIEWEKCVNRSVSRLRVSFTRVLGPEPPIEVDHPLDELIFV